MDFVDFFETIGETLAIRDLDVETGSRIHLENERSSLAIDDEVHAEIAEPRHLVALRGRLEDEVPARYEESRDQGAGVGMLVNDIVLEHTVQGLAGTEIDAGTDCTLM